MEINFVEIVINITLAAFGGLVKRLSELEKQPDKKVTLAYYTIGSIISTFVGIVVYFLCKSFNAPQFLTAGLTALAGYMGTPLLDLLSDVAKKRIKKELRNNSEKRNRK